MSHWFLLKKKQFYSYMSATTGKKNERQQSHKHFQSNTPIILIHSHKASVTIIQTEE
jgi:hypothetical protein